MLLSGMSGSSCDIHHKISIKLSPVTINPLNLWFEYTNSNLVVFYVDFNGVEVTMGM
jgi:hypothetical protein